jgi:hypothetical protein
MAPAWLTETFVASTFVASMPLSTHVSTVTSVATSFAPYAWTPIGSVSTLPAARDVDRVCGRGDEDEGDGRENVAHGGLLPGP